MSGKGSPASDGGGLHDVTILNGTVVTETRTEVLDLAIDAGIISEIGRAGTVGAAREEIDATDLYVLPGAVDAHFHCRAPSHPERGTFGSETAAAAAGGVTTVLEMPVSDPPCSTPAVLRSRRALGERECHVDFGLFSGAAVDPSVAQQMVAAGAIGFKLFTHRPPPNRVAEFSGLWADSEDGIYSALETVALTGLPCTVHAENQSLIERFESLPTPDPKSSRPPVIEAAAISLLGVLSRYTGARVHIAHMSSGAAVEALVAARTTARLTGETCPHYMIFNEEQVEQFGSMVKVAPPLRTAADNKSLWDAVATGAVDVIASDHAPFTPVEKSVSYESAPRGIPGVETMVPVVLDAVQRGVLTLARAVTALSANPARIFGLYPKKGALREGSDADVVLWNPTDENTLSLESFKSRSGGSAIAYDGMVLKGRLRRTLVRGMTVFSDGQVIGNPVGRFVQPSDRA